MIGLKQKKKKKKKKSVFNLHCWTFIDVYIEHKEEERHLPKT